MLIRRKESNEKHNHRTTHTVSSSHEWNGRLMDGLGSAGGVSHMSVGDDGKHRVRHINDMSYIES